MAFYEDLFALLSEEERQRASRYLHAAGQHEFVVGRGCLRLLLGYGLQRAPRDLEFTPGAHGKLQLSGVDFNVSHAEGLVAIAVSAAGPVGVDIEYEDRAVEVMDVAEASFTPTEIKLLDRASSSVERRRLFFTMWTELEARAKCLGLGLAALTEVRQHAHRLYVRTLDMPAGYQGALCLHTQQVQGIRKFLGKEAIAWLLDCRYSN